MIANMPLPTLVLTLGALSLPAAAPLAAKPLVATNQAAGDPLPATIRPYDETVKRSIRGIL